MGVPITEYFITGWRERQQRFPYYVWIVDNPDGPLWQLLDEEFDQLDMQTGKQVAFFVDPFMKKQWAERFLDALQIDHILSKELLNTTKQVKTFYRERLTANICKHARIGKEFLPVALISLDWRDKWVVVCYLHNGEELKSLFDFLTWRQRRQKYPDKTSYISYGNLLRSLRKRGTEVQLIHLPNVFPDSLELKSKEKAISYFMSCFQKSSVWHDFLMARDTGVAAKTEYLLKPPQGFGLSKAYVAMSALDDISGLASEIGMLSERLAERYSEDTDVMAIRKKVHRLSSIMKAVDEFGKDILSSVRSCDYSIMDGAFLKFEKTINNLGFNLEGRLIRLIGKTTYEALSDFSREAISASELIYVLSEKIPDLRRDLTASLIGYWKACEKEGRRSLHELVRRGFQIYYSFNKKICEIPPVLIDKETLGSLSIAFSSLKLAANGGTSVLSLSNKALAKLLEELTNNIRNPYTHRELLTDSEQLKRGRNLIGCENPAGILQLLISLIAEIALLEKTMPTV